MLDPHHVLTQIKDRLSQGASPTQVIEAFLPRLRADALAWARRLSLWVEYRGQFPAQVVGIARVLSLRAMRQFGLHLNEDGHVVPEQGQMSARPTAEPRLCFPLRVRDEEVRVEYAPHYFPNSDQDLFTFLSPHEPPRAHPLSETGCWAHLTSHDAVDACGGPEPYAALLAEALLRGERDFDAVFHGARPERVPRRRKPRAVRPAVQPEMPATEPEAGIPQASGPHSARILAGETVPSAPPPAEEKLRQGFLF